MKDKFLKDERKKIMEKYQRQNNQNSVMRDNVEDAILDRRNNSQNHLRNVNPNDIQIEPALPHFIGDSLSNEENGEDNQRPAIFAPIDSQEGL